MLYCIVVAVVFFCQVAEEINPVRPPLINRPGDVRFVVVVVALFLFLIQVPAEYPLRPSLVSLAGEKSGVEPAGEAALKEDLAAVANEVRVLL